MPSVPSSPNNNPYVLAGPTGAGKSAFAAELAIRLGGEIVCADAFQIYRGMGTLTAQPGPSLLSAAPHHLYGVIDPAEPFDAARFADLARQTCDKIFARGKIPILVGGSGMYLEALFSGFDPLPPIDPELRARVAEMAPEAALEELGKRDPGASSLIDCKNPRRVARALEIVIQTGRPLGESRSRGKPAAMRGAVLIREKAELDGRILANVEAMFQNGVAEEIAALEKIGPTAGRAIGLREVRAFLRREIARQDAIGAISAATRKYAKRQLTWFRNRTSLRALVISDSDPSSTCRALALAASL